MGSKYYIWMGNVLKITSRQFWMKKSRLKFDAGFIIKIYIVEMDVEHPKKLQKKHNDLPFLPERMKIKIFLKNL